MTREQWDSIVQDRIGQSGMMEIYKQCGKVYEDPDGATFFFDWEKALTMITDMLCT